MWPTSNPRPSTQWPCPTGHSTQVSEKISLAHWRSSATLTGSSENPPQTLLPKKAASKQVRPNCRQAAHVGRKAWARVSFSAISSAGLSEEPLPVQCSPRGSGIKWAYPSFCPFGCTQHGIYEQPPVLRPDLVTSPSKSCRSVESSQRGGGGKWG